MRVRTHHRFDKLQTIKTKILNNDCRYERLIKLTLTNLKLFQRSRRWAVQPEIEALKQTCIV